MKIAFVIAGVYPTYKLKEIQEMYPQAFDLETFNYIKVLEKNNDFEVEVMKIRKKLNIHLLGYDFWDYQALAIDPKDKNHDFTSDFKDLLKKAIQESLYLNEKFDIPKKIAKSLKHSADVSTRRKAKLFQSAMSMLNFYINRAGKSLKPERKKVLDKTKIELRKLFGK